MLTFNKNYDSRKVKRSGGHFCCTCGRASIKCCPCFYCCCCCQFMARGQLTHLHKITAKCQMQTFSSNNICNKNNLASFAENWLKTSLARCFHGTFRVTNSGSSSISSLENSEKTRKLGNNSGKTHPSTSVGQKANAHFAPKPKFSNLVAKFKADTAGYVGRNDSMEATYSADKLIDKF